jgi:hypothetical protein
MEAGPMVELIAWSGVIASVILFLAGVFELFIAWRSNDRVRAAADSAAKVSENVNTDAKTLQEHAGIDFKGQWEALAALATALKDLDRSTRLFFLSLAFMAVAGATVGLDSVGSGLASS